MRYKLFQSEGSANDGIISGKTKALEFSILASRMVGDGSAM